MTNEELLALRHAMMEDAEELSNVMKPEPYIDTESPEVDVVNKPKHYKGAHGLEVQEIIENFVPDPYSAHFKDAVKYLLRHMNKGKPKQDLEKCRYYVNKMIEDWGN